MAVDLSKISRGFEFVKDIKDTAETKSHFEHIEPNLIKLADDNPYNTNDTLESIEELATSIKASGLMHPLVVRKISDTEYSLISGERRYKAITTHLKWRAIPCTVYEDISDLQAQIMLHDANLATREYTPQEKLNFYPKVMECVNKMIENGEYKGAKQKAVAELLHISDRQVRKYKAIVENLSEEEISRVASGETSINSAYEQAQNSKSGTDSASSDYDEALSTKIWQQRLVEFVKYYYGTEKVYKHYLTSAPSTKQAIKKVLRPAYGLSGGYTNGCKYELRTTKLTLTFELNENTNKPVKAPQVMSFSYSAVDEIIRELIADRNLVSFEIAQKILKNEIELLKRRSEMDKWTSK